MNAVLALLLTCTNVPTPDIDKIEVFGRDDAERVVLYLKKGGKKSYTIEPTGLSVEDKLPLPSYEGSSRWLDNRHTGWAISSYAKGLVRHDKLDCE